MTKPVTQAAGAPARDRDGSEKSEVTTISCRAVVSGITRYGVHERESRQTRKRYLSYEVTRVLLNALLRRLDHAAAYCGHDKF